MDNVFANQFVFTLTKLDRIAKVSEAVRAAGVVGAQEPGHEFHFASTAAQSCHTKGYELLILSAVLVLLFVGNVATVVRPCLCLVCHGLMRTPSNQGTKSLQTIFGL